MAGQAGRDVLIKLSNEQTPPGFVTLAGIRSSEFVLNAQSIDATAADSAGGWRELIESGGIKTARVKGRGVLKDAESDHLMRDVFFRGSIRDWQLIIPSMGALRGPFHIQELSWGGAYDGEATLSVTLESAGKIEFQAAV
ncbi:MAG: phage major tail protein, TP901-1 family [Pseudomonadota bacterium]